MTYIGHDQDDDCVVPELKLRVGGDNGDYIKLREPEDCDTAGGDPQPPCFGGGWCRLFRWAKIVALSILVGVLAAVFLIWVGPFFVDKVLVLSNKIPHIFLNAYLYNPENLFVVCHCDVAHVALG